VNCVEREYRSRSKGKIWYFEQEVETGEERREGGRTEMKMEWTNGRTEVEGGWGLSVKPD
jgi:hypothetical protein